MKESKRKNQQITLINYKGAGRPAIHDKGIRHTSRPQLVRPCLLHLTVKVKKNKADIKNKTVLSFLKRAILNARRQGLKVIHYTLEYDHVHLLIEADNNITLGKGMKAFGVTLSKAINKLRQIQGSVYKHRYHFKMISSAKQLKNVLSYIFQNGVKHGTVKSKLNPFNSLRAELRSFLFYDGEIEYDWELMSYLDKGKIFFKSLEFI